MDARTFLPSLFVPHGAPTFVLQPGAAGRALAAMAARLPRPRAVIMVSAHWSSATPQAGAALRPQTLHDFWGFPDELYARQYPASGCPEGAAEVLAALRGAGFAAAADDARGLDHGAWTPLSLMFPDADIPVIPLSIQAAENPAHHFRLGQALAPLAGKGFLIVGSGNVTHNLRDYQSAAGGAAMPDYVRAFPAWLAEKLAAMDIAALLDYRRQAPDARRAHPTDEHLLPLYVALGAAAAAGPPAAHRFHAGIADHVISMDAYAFTPATAVSTHP